MGTKLLQMIIVMHLGLNLFFVNFSLQEVIKLQVGTNGNKIITNLNTNLLQMIIFMHLGLTLFYGYQITGSIQITTLDFFSMN